MTSKALTINSGSAVSEVFNLQHAKGATLHLPVVTSGSVYLQASPDETAANFVRVHNSLGSLWQFDAAAGSLAMTLGDDVLGGIGFARIETSVNQAAPRTLNILFKL